MALPFTLTWWHPFGPHGRETPEQIIERKRQEIAANGWTLWSFQYRRPRELEGWYREVSALDRQPAFVFCSDSVGARDPAVVGVPVEPTECRTYRFIGQDEWQPFHSGMRVPHPFRGGRRQASAFVVQRIVFPIESLTIPAVEWLSKGKWREDRVPTRGEYLIRPGGTTPLRPVRAVLELRAPYLALVSADARMIQRRPGPPCLLTAMPANYAVYEVTLSPTPSPEWRAAFIRPPERLTSARYTPELGRLELNGDTVIFRIAPSQLPAWLRRIDGWVAYANSVVEG
jgi:hypothetical protein